MNFAKNIIKYHVYANMALYMSLYTVKSLFVVKVRPAHKKTLKCLYIHIKGVEIQEYQ